MSQDYPIASVQIIDRESCLPLVGRTAKIPSLCPLYIELKAREQTLCCL